MLVDPNIKNPQSSLFLKMQRGDVFSDNCPSRKILEHITSRWGVLILIALLEKTHRFSELRRKINGINERMLSKTLQYLEEDALVLRKAYPVIPPHVEYSLTPLGKEAAIHLIQLTNWIEENFEKMGAI
jgi:DNA-binding HxlR family transcriptional regulator